jgi:hypothetical protein
MRNPRRYSHPPNTLALVQGGPGTAGKMAPVAHQLAGQFGLLEYLQTATKLSGQVAELAAQLRTDAKLHAT